MKLAEALVLRADTQKRLAQLRDRIADNARFQEGDDPSEDPRALLEEAERVVAELEDLIRRVNRTNAAATFDGTRTLTDALAEREALLKRRALYAEAAKAASGRQDRFLRSEIRMVAALEVPELQRRVDEISRDYRELDTRIQELNWATELSD